MGVSTTWSILTWRKVELSNFGTNNSISKNSKFSLLKVHNDMTKKQFFLLSVA